MEIPNYPLALSSPRILSSARTLTRQQNYFTYLMGLVLIPSHIRPFYYSWYAYFRWVDDLADSSKLTLPEKKHFITYQIKLVKSFYQHSSGWKYAENSPEAFLATLVLFDKQRGSPLKTPILDLLACIFYDIGRMATYPDRQQLAWHIELEVTSYLKTFLSFCCPEANLEDFPRPYEGIAGKWAHILRDFISDLKSGVINLSEEERDKFQISISGKQIESKNSNLQKWAAAKVKECELFFQQGKQNLLVHQNLRYKLGIAILCAKYEYYVYLIKKNDYHLQEKYPFNWEQFLVSFAKLCRHVGAILWSNWRQPHCHTTVRSS